MASLPELAPALRCVATLAVQRRLRSLQQARRELGFGEVQERLDAALAGPQGPRLRAHIIEQTPVALIDEFQDTSALQYRIFDALFCTQANDPATALLLIGDPKQSIYRFRGADIASYLQARRATTGRHYRLGTNFRSSTAVVQAVNALFEQAEQRLADGAFAYAQPEGRNPLPFAPVKAQGRPERWVAQGQPQAALTVCWDAELLNGDTYRQRMAALAAERISTWLMDPSAGFEGPEGFTRLCPADVAVLVPGKREAQAMRRALQARRLPSVYLSDRESVFDAQEALDMLRWLQAVAQPGDIGLVRAAWASSTWAQSLAELQRMAQDDELLDERCELMRSLQHVWRSQGVLPMWRQTLHRLGLPQRWLAQESAGPDQALSGPGGPVFGGERRLSKVLHLAELMQQAAQDAMAVPGETGLIRWLTQQVLDARTGLSQADDQIVRLESDADLVKIVTIHQSKGLEYPLVLMPFAGHFRPLNKAATKAVQRSQDDSAEKRWDFSPSDEVKAEADHERLREELRLLYVGLTRARHALWLGFAPLKHGNGNKLHSHRSALGRLLIGPSPVETAALEAAVQQWPGRFALNAAVQIEAAIDPAPQTPWVAATAPPPLAAARAYQGGFDTRWGVASFSSLVRAMATHSTALTPLPRQAADDEAQPNASEPLIPLVATPPLVAQAPWHRFERGALAGNFLHEQLEWLATQHFAWGPGTEAALRQRFERAGRSAQADDGVAWLQALLAAPLCDEAAQGPGVPAPALQRVMAEMEFWLPAAELDAPEVHRLCQTQLWPELARPALPQRQLHGLVMGFADLVVEHEGRFWVLDYKSNHLGPADAAYTPERMAQAFVEARYDVQAALYLLALHRLLRSRLGAAYQPEQHLGGALYWFIRGVAAPSHGVLTIPTPWPMLHALDAMLEGSPC
ncbi:MAG: UvrD-helicase domain-containing protein [Ideonella sp.]|nr:UvrD-helicase domain-containing protein [Ideonella sp.]